MTIIHSPPFIPLPAANESRRSTLGKPAVAAPVPEPVSQATQRSSRVMSLQNSLIDSRTAFAISQGGTIPLPANSDELTKRHIMPIKVPPIVEPTDDITTKHIQPIKVPPVGVQLLDDGGFTVSIGPDGVATCGNTPTGPVRYPPIPEPEEYM